MKRLLFFSFFLLLSNLTFSQFWFHQYFDGADTSASNSIIISLDTSSQNVWQVGKPQKTIFNSAATQPNVIVTDTVNYYPANNTSRFYFRFIEPLFSPGILALQWTQKLDMEKKQDGGIIEYSLDKGNSWQNVFNNPYVYNFYGFNSVNADTLYSGEYAFSGTDTSWANIWLCFDMSFLMNYDTVDFRYTLKSDSVNNNKEGWMIDNMWVSITFIHTAKGGQEPQEYLKIYPNVTDGIVHIEAEKMNEYHIIESIELINSEGKVVQRFGKAPTKFFVDIGNNLPGTYFLKVTTNFKTETFPVVLQKRK